jgi:hypothetical protein
VSEKTPPASVRTPAFRLEDAPTSYALGIPGAGGFSPGELWPVRILSAKRTRSDLERPPAAVQAAVPPSLRARLGVDLPPRPATAKDPPVELLVALRRHQLGQCHEAPRSGARPATEAFAGFLVDGDGRAVEVRAATQPPDGALDACLGDLVSGWEFPSSPEGIAGPYLVRYSFEAAAGPAPGYVGPGSLRPALRDPACLERALALPSGFRGSTGSVTVKLAVDATGAPALVHALTPAPDPILAAAEEAVRRCRWSPGAGDDGRPTALWTTVTVGLQGR